ncbi:alpha-ketoglutarate-dependent dioxygenase AlkB family protein [Xanthomonas fragariae]|uniref:alpha-ketoglutarate-dependent dioxygenase AlkB family protein n=1 Tax=Xanthomonas fragariae TaxID=48664 RepID=UPI000B437E48|nr:alpha-ketoglutarate-dependent dioxygenase AlkB [Xanthomonas fragariae]MDM7553564.1 alpha-ketoglutarate-dependent dioxygenase AlkB [Xanthomonas fragariae]MDM7556715.1 alpha-ketoglutarate-dependent dioxygenase AlkB [Xanthomonas fragariae]MDM7574399.1 alpha-ketoglutarate-dependent dioxygenase AlkB [Xanthomonas fragariae]MDM7577531.1 alpha-ketoglutarate-dependent dioxygenase AlkB [Xanthomonas fragariae]MDM7587701.1 alpha-ketoglutarate-dependent dioxygenase AlkB [Xanthomonas fragariae]
MKMRVALPGAEISWCRGWLQGTQADALMQVLLAQVQWDVHRICIFGRLVDSPRLSSWIGDPQASYRYSGTQFAPQPWLEVLQPLRTRLQKETGYWFNSVLVNRYRGGSDAMGWHSDDEPELGPQPLIASLSLGAMRRFAFKHRDDATLKQTLELGHGDLLLMGGDTQRHYRHALPRTAKPIGERINLTFRQIALRVPER